VTKKSTVLLDFGGTLDSDGRHWSTQFADAFETTGLSVTRPRLDEAFLAADRAINLDESVADLPFAPFIERYVRAMVVQLGQRASIETVVDIYGRRARFFFERNRALLAEHHSHLRFGIVSNFTANLPRILKEVGLDAHLDATAVSAMDGAKKPHRRLFEIVLERLGVSPGEAIMVGDSLVNDIGPAKGLGMSTIWLRGDRQYGEAAPELADYAVSSLPEAFIVCAALARNSS
jgi:putative hydrolase of the HAD superfamily